MTPTNYIFTIQLYLTRRSINQSKSVYMQLSCQFQHVHKHTQIEFKSKNDKALVKVRFHVN
jgi:hypothetical protein